MFLQWKRTAPGVIRAESDGIEAEIWSGQFGTFTSTKKYHWRIIANGKERRGYESTQAAAKHEAARAADTTR